MPPQTPAPLQEDYSSDSLTDVDTLLEPPLQEISRVETRSLDALPGSESPYVAEPAPPPPVDLFAPAALPAPATSPPPSPETAAQPISFAPLGTGHVASVAPPLGASVAARAPARPEVSSRPPRAALTMRQALTAQVRFAQVDMPLWVFLSPLIALLSCTLALGAVLVGSLLESEPPAPAAADSKPAQKAQAPLAAAPASPPSPLTDTSALEKKPKDSLTSLELLALADAGIEREHQAARLLRQRLAADPAELKAKATLVELRKATENPHTANEALAALAAMAGPLGVDLLYEVWTGTPARTDTTELARSLVYSPDVRVKASPALAVALDLRRAETCEQQRELLPRALGDGDRRALHLLLKLKRKTGCGPNKRQDCYACLREREGEELDAAITAVKSRRAPNGFAAP